MNLEKARETALHIRKDPAHWNQGSWWTVNGRASGQVMPASALLDYTCGTTACVAGWRVALSFPGAVFAGTYDFRMPDGTLHAIDRAAARELELTDEQASWLFSGLRTEEQVMWALENENGDWLPGEYWMDPETER